MWNAPAYGGRSVCVYVNKKLIINICAGVDLINYKWICVGETCELCVFFVIMVFVVELLDDLISTLYL